MSLIGGNDFTDTFTFVKSGLNLIYFRQGPLLHFDQVFNELAQRKNQYNLGNINFYAVETTPALISKASMNSPPLTLAAPGLILFHNHKAFSKVGISDIQGLVITLRKLLAEVSKAEAARQSYAMIPQNAVIPQNAPTFNLPALRGARKFDPSAPWQAQDTDYNKELLAGDEGIIPYTVPWKIDLR